MKAMIVPGNGNADIKENWYQDVKKNLENLGLDVIAENMPDPELARKEYWIPFIKEKVSEDSCILIGHSSGAVAILKYLEENKCDLAILIGAYYTDLDDEDEKKSGYFDEPWKWEKIKNNSKKIIIFASKDDPYIPISEPLFIKEKLNAEYFEYNDEGHFGSDVGKKDFPEIILFIKKFLDKK